MTGRDPNIDPREEEEANYFARCLLMPRRFVEDYSRQHGGIDIYDDNELKALADAFQVPVGLAAYRLADIRREQEAAS